MTREQADEIRVHVRQAKDPMAQISREAQLNDCPAYMILEVLPEEVQKAYRETRHSECRKHKWSTPERRAEAVREVQLGCLRCDVAKKYGVAAETLANWCKAAGVVALNGNCMTRGEIDAARARFRAL